MRIGLVLLLLLAPLLTGCLQAAQAEAACAEPQPGFAEGRVLLEGAPVPGALVWWHTTNLTHGLGGLEADRAARAEGTLTGDDGRFRLAGDGHELRVHAPGALTATVPADACTVHLAADRFRVIGHRGTGFHAPENSELAFRVAAAQGATVLEMDVRRTSDDVLVVWHDAGLERLAGLPLSVAATPWAVLADVLVAGAGEPQPVLRLHEALGIADELDRPVVLDLKGSPRNVTRTLELLAPLLDGRDAWGRTWLAVRYDSNVDECLALPEARCVVHRFGGSDPLRVPLERGASVVSLRHTSVDAETVARAHRHGVEVWAWTVNHEADWDRMLAAGVDGIVTDRPQELSDVVRRSGPADG